MIPVRDSVRSRRFPVVTVAIIAVNVAIYIYQTNLSNQGLQYFFLRNGIIPVQFTLLPRWLAAGKLSIVAHLLGTLVSSMFIHGGLLHLLGNMLYLWVFGDNVEDRLGTVRYLVFYVVTGSIATVAHIFSAPDSTVPLIGASGAIAGVLGGYFIAFPRSRVLAVIPVFFFLHMTEVPALVFLAFWFVLQLIYGLGSLDPGSADVVAWWAHVGGFAAGAILMRVFAGGRTATAWRDNRGGPWGPVD